MEIILSNIYIFLMALVLANLEIQIEGKNGWAEELPTWQPHKNTFYAKVFAKMMCRKQLTGYHLAMFLFVFLTFYFPFLMGAPFSFESFLKITSLLFVFLALWDFLWFICNPYYTLNRFNKNHVWWHSQWFLGIPVDYFSALFASVVALVPLMLQNAQIMIWWTFNLGLFSIETLTTIIFTTYILKIPTWHHKQK